MVEDLPAVSMTVGPEEEISERLPRAMELALMNCRLDQPGGWILTGNSPRSAFERESASVAVLHAP